jgi:hypothetical protein
MAMTRRNLMYFYGMSAIGQVAITKEQFACGYLSSKKGKHHFVR